MTKVVFGREIVPFDTEEEWEKFWERESGRPSRHIRAQDSWNTYNTALQEIKNGKKNSLDVVYISTNGITWQKFQE